MFGRRLIGRRVKATMPNTTSAMAHIVTVTRRLNENSMRLIVGPSPGSAAGRTIGGGAEVGRLGRGDDLDRRALSQPTLAGHDHLLARLHTGQRLDPAALLEAEGDGALLRHAARGHEDVGVAQLSDDRFAREQGRLARRRANYVDRCE